MRWFVMRVKLSRYCVRVFMAAIFVAASILLSACSKPVLKTSNNHLVSISSLKGKWVFINYWASWCVHCRKEVPELNKFYQDHRDKVVVLGINYDGLVNPQLASAVHRFGITFPVLATNPWKMFHLNEVNVVPTTFVLNPQGHLVYKLLGPQTESGLEALMNTSSQNA